MADTAHAGGAHADFDLDRVAETAMRLAEAHGWNRVGLLDVARAAGVPLAELYRRCRSKQQLLAAFARKVDADVLENVDPEDLEEPAKDRLFELLMERFDRLKPYRRGVRSILQSARRDPAQALGGLTQLRRSMRVMLEAAGLSGTGLRGELRLTGLCGVYLNALRAFVDDDSEDLSRTMAALDRTLQRVERPAEVLEGRERPGELVREQLGRRVREGLAKRGLSGSAPEHAGPTLEAEAEEVVEPFDSGGSRNGRARDPMTDPRP